MKLQTNKKTPKRQTSKKTASLKRFFWGENPLRSKLKYFPCPWKGIQAIVFFLNNNYHSLRTSYFLELSIVHMLRHFIITNAQVPRVLRSYFGFLSPPNKSLRFSDLKWQQSSEWLCCQNAGVMKATAKLNQNKKGKHWYRHHWLLIAPSLVIWSTDVAGFAREQ